LLYGYFDIGIDIDGRRPTEILRIHLINVEGLSLAVVHVADRLDAWNVAIAVHPVVTEIVERKFVALAADDIEIGV